MGLVCSWTFPTQAQGALKPHWKHVQDKQTRGILWLTKGSCGCHKHWLKGRADRRGKVHRRKKIYSQLLSKRNHSWHKVPELNTAGARKVSGQDQECLSSSCSSLLTATAGARSAGWPLQVELTQLPQVQPRVPLQEFDFLFCF